MIRILYFTLCAVIFTACEFNTETQDLRHKVPDIFPLKKLVYSNTMLAPPCTINIFKVEESFSQEPFKNSKEIAIYIKKNGKRIKRYQPWRETPISEKLHEESKGHLTIYKAAECLTKYPKYKTTFIKYRDSKNAYFTTVRIGQTILMYVPVENLLFVTEYD